MKKVPGQSTFPEKNDDPKVTACVAAASAIKLSHDLRASENIAAAIAGQ